MWCAVFVFFLRRSIRIDQYRRWSARKRAAVVNVRRLRAAITAWFGPRPLIHNPCLITINCRNLVFDFNKFVIARSGRQSFVPSHLYPYQVSMIRYLKVAYLSLELGTTSSYRLSSAPVDDHRGMSFIVWASIRSGRLYELRRAILILFVEYGYQKWDCNNRKLKQRQGQREQQKKVIALGPMNANSDIIFWPPDTWERSL